MHCQTFFCSTSYLELDGFDQDYQASVHFPVTSTVNKSQQHRNKILGMLRIGPGATGCEARILPLCYPAPTLSIFSIEEKLIETLVL